MSRRVVALASTAVALSLAIGLTAIAVAETGEPSPPSWVKPDGTVDTSKLPSRMPMVDSNGDLVLDASGKPVMVSLRDLGDFSGSEPHTVTSEPDGWVNETIVAGPTSPTPG
jgi:hypothetical protein